MSLKLVSLNMELDRHRDEQKRFLDREAPDVICLQEVHEVEFDALRAEHGHGAFAPMCLTRRLDGRFARQGVCIVSRHALRQPQSRPYRDPGGPLIEFEVHRTPQTMIRRVLLLAGVQQAEGRTRSSFAMSTCCSRIWSVASPSSSAAISTPRAAARSFQGSRRATPTTSPPAAPPASMAPAIAPARCNSWSTAYSRAPA
jgi:exonuclease III